MKTITLPVFFNTEESTRLEEIGINVDFEELIVKDVFFTSIDFFHAHYEMPQYSNVGVGGAGFIVKMNTEQVTKELQKL